MDITHLELSSTHSLSQAWPKVLGTVSSSVGQERPRYCDSSLLCYRMAVYSWSLPFLTHFIWFVRSSGHSSLLGTQPLNPKSPWSQLRAHRWYHSANSTYVWVLKWSFCGFQGSDFKSSAVTGRKCFYPMSGFPLCLLLPTSHLLHLEWLTNDGNI